MPRENSAQRAKRYCKELKQRKHLSGKKKGQALTGVEAGFRMGVVNQRVRQGKAYARSQQQS